ncbi:MAG TPA: glycosyltransferase family 2 protein [Pyrinomonadaceae bacterium]|nr:glycosyltransferase family 2 protein [Acidobacteriota bacterium]HQZ96569.1 glycosyltransferase family 2 protein [Pyrinomonadaceae bacterium]
MKKRNAKNFSMGRDFRSSSSEIPKVSVVIPVYNAAGSIVETLESVFAQTDPRFEILIINDGSPDTEQLEQVIKPYLERITYIKQQNAGAAAARNAGIKKSRGEIIAFLDGDDVWSPEYLASQVEFLETGGFAMVYCDADLFGTPSVAGKTFMEGSPSSGEVTVESLFDLRCNVITSGTIVKKSVVEAAGLFENERVLSEDFHLWVRIAHLGEPIGYQRKRLLKYRVSVDGLSGHAVNRVERAIDVFKRLDRDLDLSSEQRSILKRRIAGFESDLEMEKGKAFLIGGNFDLARRSFREANRHRRSLKLTAISVMLRLVPRLVLKIYKVNNADEIAFVHKLDRTAASQ